MARGECRVSPMLAVAPKALWYLTRGTGAVALLLLTLSVVLGIAHSVRWSPGHTPRFVVQDLHRNVSLLVVVFIAVHVSTAVIDGFAPIRWLDAIVPFTSAYRAMWLGLGALATDILLAVAITSLLRARLGFRVWKGIHWSAYACWLIALFHGLGVGSDTRQTWMLALVVCSVIAVVAATGWRAALGWSSWNPTRVTLATGAATAPFVVAAFLVLGPLQTGWARSAGTPSRILASSIHRATSVPPVSLVLPAQAHFAGTAELSAPSADGRTVLSGDALLASNPRFDVRINVAGSQTEGGLSVGSGSMTIVPPDGAAVYRGPVTGLSETGGLEATLSDGQGDQIAVAMDLAVSPSGALSGELAIHALTIGGVTTTGDRE